MALDGPEEPVEILLGGHTSLQPPIRPIAQNGAERVLAIA